jgi:uncharacterized protein (TIGR03118 family)
MKKVHLTLALGALLVISFPFRSESQQGGYVETDLVVNKQSGGVPTLVDSNGVTHVATFFDQNLVNPWGIAESSSSFFWLSDNGTGQSTLYNTPGTPQALVVSIPSPDDPLGTGGAPTGVAFNTANASGAFQISGFNSAGSPITAPALFLFATEDGTILGWNPMVNPFGFDTAKAGRYAIIAATVPGAIYKGLAIATDASGVTRMYAANFHAGTVDVFGTSFQQITSNGAFTDPDLPRGYAPFNVASITMNGSSRLFVSYALQDADKEDEIEGQGFGIVNTFHLDGTTPQRFAQRGQLDAPWGIALAPAGFGSLGGTLLIGNFGNGHINAFDAQSGQFIEKVRDSHGQVIAIDGLWALQFGNNGNGGMANTLYFTAGPNDEQDGLFGSLSPESAGGNNRNR